jgi:amino acid adenylation domain-containing protein
MAMQQTVTPFNDSERVKAKCFHPSGCCLKFPQDEIEQSIPERFEKIVALYPNRIAIGTPEETLSYSQLNARANRLAQAIVSKHGSKQQPVGLILAKGLPLIVAALGVLKAGKMYVLIDPSYPFKRIRYILNHAQIQLFITNDNRVAATSALADGQRQFIALKNIHDNGPVHDLKLTIPPDSLACIHYTSGSTDEPKGVTQSHRRVLHKVLAETKDTHLCLHDRFTFPASRGGDMYSALLNGASVYPLDIKERGFPGLIKSLQQDAITIYSSVTSTFRYLLHTLNEDQNFPHVRMVRLIGEPLYKADVALYKKHFSENCVLIIRLGSNETGTFCQKFLDHRTPLDENVISLGYPANDCDVLLLDDFGKEVADGEIGEFAVRGSHLDAGYWRNPKLTKIAFAVDPDNEANRIYRVGDLGRRRADGSYVHLGRKDFQLKINGNRVEVAEVEGALLNCDNVKETAVVGIDDASGGKRLAAYLVSLRQPAPTALDLRNKLAATLPDFMIPSTFVFMEALPVIGTGKVDRRALPEIDSGNVFEQRGYQAPRTDAEEILCSVWAKIFHLPRVGIDDDFFLLGGHSLLAAQMFALLEEKFGRSFPLSILLSSPTIRQLAEHFSMLHEKPTRLQSLVPLRSKGSIPAIFAIPGIFGNVLGFADLCRELGDERRFYALQSIGLDGQQRPIESIEEMAERYIGEIKSVQNHGPFVIFGACFGATVAYEIARQLLTAGQKVAYLGLFDPATRELPDETEFDRESSGIWNRTRALGSLLSRRITLYREELRSEEGYERIRYLLRKIFAAGSTLSNRNQAKRLSREFHQLEVARANHRALNRYRRKNLSGPLVAFDVFESTHPRNLRPHKFSWQTLWSGKIIYHLVSAKDSGAMLVKDNVIEIARILADRLKVSLDNNTKGYGHSATGSDQDYSVEEHTYLQH